MKKFFFDCGHRDNAGSMGIFVLRVMIGAMMLIGHGIPKIQHFATIKTNFTVPNLFPFYFMSPAVSLGTCIAGEVLAAALIIMGLATRPAALFLGFTMVVAAFQVEGASPWFLDQGVTSAKEPALLYLIAMISLIFSGAGLYSLDASLYREKKTRRW